MESYRAPFTVEVRLIPETYLWSWEIRDPVQGEVVESCWAHDWTAYDSRDAALRAGHLRLVRRYPSRTAGRMRCPPEAA